MSPRSTLKQLMVMVTLAGQTLAFPALANAAAMEHRSRPSEDLGRAAVRAEISEETRDPGRAAAIENHQHEVGANIATSFRAALGPGFFTAIGTGVTVGAGGAGTAILVHQKSEPLYNTSSKKDAARDVFKAPLMASVKSRTLSYEDYRSAMDDYDATADRSSAVRAKVRTGLTIASGVAGAGLMAVAAHAGVPFVVGAVGTLASGAATLNGLAHTVGDVAAGVGLSRRQGAGLLRSAVAGVGRMANRTSTVAQAAIASGMTEAFADSMVSHPSPHFQAVGHTLRMTGLGVAAAGVVYHGGALHAAKELGNSIRATASALVSLHPRAQDGVAENASKE